MPSHPEFFYLSVTSACILMTIGVYYFMRLPIYVAAIVSSIVGFATFYTVHQSGVYDSAVIVRMLTYIGVANAVGLWMRTIFDGRERKIFLQNHRLQRVSALRKRMMLAEFEANQAKTKLIAMLSHEIRTPMNTVARLMDSIQRDLGGQLSSKRMEVFRQVEQACDYLLTTLDDLLHYSATSGQPAERIEPRSFMVTELLEECCELVSPLADEKGLRLTLEVKSMQDVRLLGQSNQIKRILLNLLGNAIKFTSQGSVTVRASVNMDEGDMTQLTVAVEDTGIGIPPDEQANIFQLFYQVDSSYSRRFGGTGLGLSISQRMVQSMGGSLSVESEVGKGSMFTINLRLPTLQNHT